MFLKSLEMLQFSFWSNLPVRVLYKGAGDLLNFLIVFIIIVYSEAVVGTLLFGIDLVEFNDV